MTKQQQWKIKLYTEKDRLERSTQHSKLSSAHLKSKVSSGRMKQMLMYDVLYSTEKKSSMSEIRTDVHAVHGQSAGIRGTPVLQEELLHLTLQSLLTFSDHWAGLVHNQTHTRCFSEVVLRPVGRPWGQKLSSVKQWTTICGLTCLSQVFRLNCLKKCYEKYTLKL